MSKWLQFLRCYGPIAANDNIYDEHIGKTAKKLKIEPPVFEHPFENRLVDALNETTTRIIVLTGTAGDGKTFLCRKSWILLGGSEKEWSEWNQSQNVSLSLQRGGRKFHFIPDLSAWAPQHGEEWPSEKLDLIRRIASSFETSGGNDCYVIAANDGQLVELWRRPPIEDELLGPIRQEIEDMLVNDDNNSDGGTLRMFNLSRSPSAELFEQALKVILQHDGWKELVEGLPQDDNQLFGKQCPIRRNYELLQNDLIQKRLRSLLYLCDHNNLHVPIRQVLLLISNILFGHPDVNKDRLMNPKDVPKLIAKGTSQKSCFYDNIFGGNLSETKRSRYAIFRYLDRFQIGLETTNRIDSFLIYDDPCDASGLNGLLGLEDEPDVKRFNDARKRYLDGFSDKEDEQHEFRELLVAERRKFFFKIPENKEKELRLWDLTVFNYAGEYLNDILARLQNGRKPDRTLLACLVRGLNRVFTGMLVSSDDTLYLATNSSHSQTKICRILLNDVSVDPRKGDKIFFDFEKPQKISIKVYSDNKERGALTLTLVRYEFLMRIAMEGTLPASFSRECYEDILAFKNKLIATCRENEQEILDQEQVSLNILALTGSGLIEYKRLEVRT